MTSPSPISKLNNDTLLMIFDTITCRMSSSDIKRADKPVTIVRAVSQVCQRWRELSLASPWIWGRVIDLDSDCGEYSGPLRTLKWMDEVVRRAGSAPLWITGDVVEQDSEGQSLNMFDSLSFFVKLLESWERIEQLSVVLCLEEVPDDIQIRFLSPAPILKLFDVKLLYDVADPLFLDTLQPGSSQRLFADYAPLLREILGDQLAYRLDSPWLSSIQEINPIPCRLTLEEIFFLLQHTPVIQSIYVDGPELHEWDGMLPPLPKLSLPKLSSIMMYANLAVGAKILDHISPHKPSSFRINLSECTPVLHDRSILTSFKKNLPFYISGYFTANPSTALLLVIEDKQFKFCNLGKRGVGGETFDIAITSSASKQRETDDLVECLLDTFRLSSTHDHGNPSLFQSVTEVMLRFAKVQRTVIPTLRAMLGIFPHVQLIKINERSCQTLFDISRLDETGENLGQNVLFPELRTLCLTSIGEVNVTALNSFLIHRKKIGFPVGKLDLSGRSVSLYTRDLRRRAAEELDGLEVVWKQRQGDSREDHETFRYICGTTGEPGDYISRGDA